MNEIDGFKVREIIRRELRIKSMEIIYMSSDKNNVWESTTAKTSGFIVKPININNISKPLREAIESVEQKKPVFYYTSQRIVKKIYWSDIIYFRKDRNKINIIGLNGFNDSFYGNMAELCGKKCHSFIRVSVSHYINFDQICSRNNKRVVMSDSEEIIITQSYRAKANEKMRLLTSEKF